MCDIEPYKNNPDHNWVYNKPLLCDLQGIQWYPCPIEPPIFPVIMRPVFNLLGMGAEATKIHSIEEFKNQSKYGYFSTPFIEGAHTSHDFIVDNGIFTNETIFKGYPLKEHTGAFLYWELLSKNKQPVMTPFLTKLQDKMKGYSGPLNVECIDNKIIECHLRVGDIDIIQDQTRPLYLVPIWGTKYMNMKINIDNIKKQEGVIDVIVDSNNISITNSHLQRKAIVVTKILPKNISHSL